MTDDGQSHHDDEELVLPDEDEFDERHRPRIDLPEAAKTSPILRRIIVGGGGEKPKDLGGKRPRVEVKSHGASPGDGLKGSVEEPPRQSLERSPLEVRSSAGAAARASSERGGTQPGGEHDDLSHGDPTLDTTPPEVDPMIGESAPGGTAEPKTPVDRPVKGRRRRHRKSGKAFSEDAWSGRAGSSLWWWISVGVVCAVFLIALIGLRFMRPTMPVEEVVADREVIDDSIESTPIVDFVTRADELVGQLDEIVRLFEAGEDHEKILRGGAASTARLKEWRKRVPKPAPVHFDYDRSLNAMAVGEFGFVVLQGTRQDFSRFDLYFVKEGDGMLLDWEASEGFSEVLPGEVAELADREPHMMRALANGDNFYTDLYPDDRYQCFTLQHRDRAEYVWAFAELRSMEHRILRDLILQGGPRGNERRVTVKVRRGVEGSRPNQVELLEVLHGEWISPPSKEDSGNDEGINPPQ